MTMLNNADPKLYDRRRCQAITKAGSRCKCFAQNGYDHCCQHLTPKEKDASERIKRGEVIPSEEAGQCTSIVTDTKNPNKGKRCIKPALPGWTRCFMHLTPLEKNTWRSQRRRAINKAKLHDHTDGSKKVPPPPLDIRNPRANKPYDGFKSTIDNETIVQVSDGDVYGFYGGAFLTDTQRDMFKSAPVGDIDDDIKIIRYLIRDALENQVLYINAVACGSVEGAFVVFSKEVAETVDDDGRVIASQTRTIKRRRDYLEDIQKLQRLLTVMEGARIDIKKASDDFDTDIVPFNFNVLPPSDDHPQYGSDEEGDGEAEEVQE